MFGFSFAMVPLYRLVCSVTGLNSIATNALTKTDESEEREVDINRWVTVEFDTTIHADLPLEFRSETRRIKVHPGEVKELLFYAKNLSDEPVTLQAVPGVTPWQATKHLHKIECFCFNKQTLAAGELVEMPLRFYLDNELPKQFERVTLSYSIMKIKGVD